MKRLLYLSFSTGALLGISLLAEASSISVSPTRLYINPDSAASVLTLTNAGDEKALVEVKVYAWTDGDDRNAIEPTGDLLVAPPIFETNPEDTQTLRLFPRLDGQLDKERMYRLVIKEVRSDIGPENGVGFSVEMSLPIFIAPDGASAQPVWSLQQNGAAPPTLMLANQGDAHLRLRSFELLDQVKGQPVFSSDEAVYVFPGEDRSWSLDSDRIDSDQPLLLKAETTKGDIETVISPTGG